MILKANAGSNLVHLVSSDLVNMEQNLLGGLDLGFILCSPHLLRRKPLGSDKQHRQA